MKGIFSYESKFFQFLVQLANLIFLNFLFLLCCLPVFTIGAAQAGLMNATRIMQDPENDSSWLKAFFRGFSSGFLRITVIWAVCLVIIGFMLQMLFAVIYFDAIWHNGPMISAILALAAFMLFQSMVMAFHSRFDCTALQLIRSAWFMILMHPIKALCMTLLIWGPVILALLDLYLFFQLTPAWMFLYYSAAFQGCAMLMRGPFQDVQNQFFPPEQAEKEEDSNDLEE